MLFVNLNVNNVIDVIYVCIRFVYRYRTRNGSLRKEILRKEKRPMGRQAERPAREIALEAKNIDYCFYRSPFLCITVS